MSPTGPTSAALAKRTPLYDAHVAQGAKMVEFAGYDMPVQYPAGIMTEHTHTRAQASLFDVSHMGQVSIRGAGAAEALERLVPGDIAGLAPWALRYTQFTNDDGGIIDDLIVTNGGDRLLLVVNAACKDADLAHLRAGLGDGLDVAMHDGKALIAIQGPAAACALARHSPGCAALKFMTAAAMRVAGTDALVSRSGYTGEDGFEISVEAEAAGDVWDALSAEPEVAPAGLGARDSLRLEAGLCLYGHDIDATTSPIEAGLAWSIGKRRRAPGGFPGAARIQRELAHGVRRKRVGIAPEGRAPAREHTEVRDQAGAPIGEVTSGGFGPTVGRPVAMGYVDADAATMDAPVTLLVRDKARPARITKLPFVAHHYFKG